MPINEATRKSRERWPLAFDIEGVPRDTQLRQRLLEQHNLSETFSSNPEEPTMNHVVNHFAGEKTPAPTIVDINNPPVPRYGTQQNPHREFPKLVYHHESGRVLQVEDDKQLKIALKKGFQLKPSPDHDYSKARAGMVAPKKQQVPEREQVLTAAELDELEAE